MKQLLLRMGCGIVLLWTGIGAHAQKSAKTPGVKTVIVNTEAADKLLGKKIQQQSLSNGKHEQLGSIAEPPEKKYQPTAGVNRGKRSEVTAAQEKAETLSRKMHRPNPAPEQML